MICTISNVHQFEGNKCKRRHFSEIIKSQKSEKSAEKYRKCEKVWFCTCDSILFLKYQGIFYNEYTTLFMVVNLYCSTIINYYWHLINWNKVKTNILLQRSREWLPSSPEPGAHVSSFRRCTLYPPLSVNAPFYGYVKLLQATLNRKKSKQGCEVTRNQTQDL